MFLKTETSMIVGWFTVVYAIFRFSQEKVLHLPWAIRVTFCKYFLNNFFFFQSLTQSFCILKEHKRTQFGSTLQADVTDIPRTSEIFIWRSQVSSAGEGRLLQSKRSRNFTFSVPFFPKNTRRCTLAHSYSPTTAQFWQPAFHLGPGQW